ncbi:unnamed protein product, partial [Closterium sp. Naga37s-1]
MVVLLVGYRAGREMDEGGAARHEAAPGITGENGDGDAREEEGERGAADGESERCEGAETAPRCKRSAFPPVTADMIAVAEQGSLSARLLSMCACDAVAVTSRLTLQLI